MERPEFDVVFSISDLHMGPEEALQTFEQEQALARAIDRMGSDGAKRVALVVNGDIVDFLARDTDRSFDPGSAASVLTTIQKRFPEVFKAWGSFVQKENRTLIFNLGNHDAELGLREHQDWLRQQLVSGEAKGSLVFSFDPGGAGVRYAGYECLCGKRLVKIAHGNEVDPWNVIPASAVRSADPTLGTPKNHINAGSALVVELMNPIKRDYRFVDLLKPEDTAVPAVLLALSPGLLGRFGRFLRLLGRKTGDSWRIFWGLLGEGARPEEVSDELLAAHAVARWMASGEPPEEMIQRVWRMRGMTPLQVAIEEQRDASESAVLLAGFRHPMPGLRQALETVQATWKGFSPKTEDDTFKKMSERYLMFDGVLIAGHTHLRRFIRNGTNTYLNTGTWMPLIKLDDVLDSRQSFEEFYALAGVEGANLLGRFKTHILSVAEVRDGKASLKAADERGELKDDPDGKLSEA